MGGWWFGFELNGPLLSLVNLWISLSYPNKASGFDLEHAY